MGRVVLLFLQHCRGIVVAQLTLPVLFRQKHGVCLAKMMLDLIRRVRRHDNASDSASSARPSRKATQARRVHEAKHSRPDNPRRNLPERRRKAESGCMRGAMKRVHACRGLRPDVPEYTPQGFAALMKRCWAALPGHRPSFKEIAGILSTMHKESL